MGTVKRIDLDAIVFKTEQRLLRKSERNKRWRSGPHTRFAYLPELAVVEVTTDEKERPMFWVPTGDVAEMHPAPEASAPVGRKQMRVETPGA